MPWWKRRWGVALLLFAGLLVVSWIIATQDGQAVEPDGVAEYPALVAGAADVGAGRVGTAISLA